jgi:hypothetical protein
MWVSCVEQGGVQEKSVTPIAEQRLSALQQALDGKGHDVLVLATRRPSPNTPTNTQ